MTTLATSIAVLRPNLTGAAKTLAKAHGYRLVAYALAMAAFDTLSQVEDADFATIEIGDIVHAAWLQVQEDWTHDELMANIEIMIAAARAGGGGA